MNIIKVTFTRKPRAPVNCKEVSYLVEERHLGLALEKARNTFTKEHKLHKYYREAIAANQRVL